MQAISRLIPPLLTLALLTLGYFMSSGAALAQDRSADPVSRGMIAVGPGVAPEYDGASDLRVIPLVFGDLRLGGVNLEFRGLRIRADLAADPRLAIGPVLGLRLPRDNADGVVGLLSDIDTAIEAGAFVGYRLGGDARGQGAVQIELSALHDISQAHNGLVATASVGYAAVRRSDFALTLDVQSSWASSDYTRTYFGISPADAAVSGLAAYRPGSGIRDVGAGLTAGYSFSNSLGLIGRVGAQYLVGETADSPIVDEGSRWQPVAGLALSYRF